MQNGHVLGEDSDIVSIWNTGLTSYTDQNWEETIDMMEEALRLYEQYKKQTLICHKQCEHNGNGKHMDHIVCFFQGLNIWRL